MFKKKKSDRAEEKAAPEERAESNRWGLDAYLKQLMLAVLLITLLAGGALYLLRIQQANQAGEQSARNTARLMAGRIADFVSQYKEMAVKFAASPSLEAPLQARDAEVLQRQSAALLRFLPQGSAVRLFPRDWDKLDERSKPPVSFASLDMLRSVESTGAPTRFEVHQFNTPQQHLVLAVPVGPADGVAGGALLTLPFNLLQRQWVGLDDQGRFQLQQVVAGNAVPLISNGTLPASEIVGAIPVEGTIWQLAYAGRGVAGSAWMTIAVLAVAGILILIAASLLQRALKRHFAHDTGVLPTLVGSVSRGRGTTKAFMAQTVEMQAVFNLVSQLGQTVDDRSQSEPDGESVSEEITPQDSLPDEVSAAQPESPSQSGIPEQIFGAYDIRGIVGRTLTEEIVYELGRAIGSESSERGQKTVIVARDGRESSQSLCDALSRGVLNSGCHVVDIGMAPTPLLYFATHYLGSNSGVVVTGSHNPKEYNGLKVVIGGEAQTGEALRRLSERLKTGNLLQGKGVRTEQALIEDYIGRVTDDIQLMRPLKVVVDSGNGVAGLVAPRLMSGIGCEVIELYSDVDGSFPHHHPDPAQPRNLVDLITIVKQQGADIGLAFDGDGDRLGVVDSEGKIIWPDRVLMLLAGDILSRNPGADVIFDVKSTRYLASEILTHGGRPIMWKTGHSLMKAKMRETGALLAGEMTGHIYINERWYGFDDAFYAAARLLEILSGEVVQSAEVFAEMPEAVATHEMVMPVMHGNAHEIVTKFAADADFPNAKIIDIDGVRAEFEDGWGLVRASNTTPAVVFRFEADSGAALGRIQAIVKERFVAVAPDEKLPF